MVSINNRRVWNVRCLLTSSLVVHDFRVFVQPLLVHTGR